MLGIRLRSGKARLYALCGVWQDPFARDDPPTPVYRGGRRSAPLPKSAQFVIIAAALIIGFTIYSLNGATDAAQGPAFIAFFGTLIAGYVLVRVLRNPLPYIALAVFLFAVDAFFFDGTAAPQAGIYLSYFGEQVRDALVP